MSSQQDPKAPPRFYLPSTTSSSPHTPVHPLSRVHSRAQSDTHSHSHSSTSTSMIESSSNPLSMSSHHNHNQNHNHNALSNQRRSSKASINNLRSALELYQIDQHYHHHHHHPSSSSSTSVSNNTLSPDLGEPSTGIGQVNASSSTAANGLNTQYDQTQQQPQSRRHSHSSNTTSTDHTPTQAHSSPTSSDDLSTSKMDALVEIHRVLYRGKEDLQSKRIELTLKEEAEQVRRVIERWFESDCVYDQPLVHLTSRESLLVHFALLHIFGTIYLPSFTPYWIVNHAKYVITQLKKHLLPLDEDLNDTSNVISEVKEGKMKSSSLPPKLPIPNLGQEERLLGLGLGLSDSSIPSAKRGGSDGKLKGDSRLKNRHEGWWKLWDVTADCKEIGEMECYDGHYLALIEHVVRLSFFPTFRMSNYLESPKSHPSAYFHPKTPNSHHHHHLHFHHHHQIRDRSSRIASPTFGIGIPALPVPSFAKRIVRYVRSDLECWLDWELRVNTMVQFNEVGKATLETDKSTKSSKQGKMLTMHGINTVEKSTNAKVEYSTEQLPGAVTSPNEKPPHGSAKTSSSAPMAIKTPLVDNQSSKASSRVRKLSAPTPLTSTQNILGLEGVAPPTTLTQRESIDQIAPNVDRD
ncbi:uncharacterized protein L201_004592 [Kwoniella dendrophila CBS 6074]|uniref:Uncharacterized protein n=1 Tax=Kwoniella dendrophila CBS 6074 TaxID=1295534 RepID=A0AAX4JY70_9TREE